MSTHSQDRQPRVLRRSCNRAVSSCTCPTTIGEQTESLDASCKQIFLSPDSTLLSNEGNVLDRGSSCELTTEKIVVRSDVLIRSWRKSEISATILLELSPSTFCRLGCCTCWVVQRLDFCLLSHGFLCHCYFINALRSYAQVAFFFARAQLAMISIIVLHNDLASISSWPSSEQLIILVHVYEGEGESMSTRIISYRSPSIMCLTLQISHE